MSVPKIMALRMGIYGILIGYLLCDFFVFKGPIYQSLNRAPVDHETAVAEAKAEGVAARVYHRPIFRTQIEEAMKEYLWRRGRTPAETSAPERRLLRELVLNDLIDEELLKLQIKVSMKKSFEIPEDRLAQAIAAEKQRYPDPDVFSALAAKADWQGEKERTLRVEARLQREKYLRDFVHLEVTEDEVRAWYDGNEKAFEGASFDEVRVSIKDALDLQKRDVAWARFRREKLYRYAEGKIEIFEEVVYSEVESKKRESER